MVFGRQCAAAALQAAPLTLRLLFTCCIRDTVTMEPELVMDVVKQALLMVVTLSLPILAVGLVVGLIIALFQALTQIQEMSLTFVPKIIAVFIALFLLTPLGMAYLSEFMRLLADLMIGGEQVQ